MSVAISATSGNVCPGDDAAESFVVGVVVAPDDVVADHAALFFVAEVVGAVEGEVPQDGERGSGLSTRRWQGVGDLGVVGRGPLPDALVFAGGQVG